MTPRRRTASREVSAALLNAAGAVLDRDGTDGVTVRAVAHEAAVAPMSVYNRFDNKDGLLVALATRALEELAAAIDVPAQVEPLERFREACRNYRDFALQHPARYSLIFGAGSPLEDQASPVATTGRAVFDALTSLIEDMRTPTAQPSSAESAQIVWGAIHGAVTIEQVGIGQTPDSDTTFENLLTLLVGSLTNRSAAADPRRRA
ncbi:TetR/AcrR family transcriptional regulator [Mycolicibacterium sp. P9-22]|uniref:TetR/AcrR family transcriptional regulator n=1 Tax=Mycolicibacterium sp. P9-22 TaxID=2024613 RepID=UPI001883229A|nr:TetR/AcrR family transcriptional regulator [Mycolicibacterium sp. P9-22]